MAAASLLVLAAGSVFAQAPQSAPSPLSGAPQFEENKPFRPSEVSQTIESASHTSGMHSEAASAMVRELAKYYQALPPAQAQPGAGPMAQLLQNMPAQALQGFADGLKASPGSRPLAVGHAVTLFQLARYEESAGELCRLATQPGTNPTELVPLLENLAALVPTRAAQVTQALRQLLRQAPESAELHLALGMALAVSKPTEATALLQRATVLAPKDARPHLQLGKLYSNGQQTPRAITALRAALQRDPNLADAHYRLALLLFQTGRKEEGNLHMAAFRKLH